MDAGPRGMGLHWNKKKTRNKTKNKTLTNKHGAATFVSAWCLTQRSLKHVAKQEVGFWDQSVKLRKKKKNHGHYILTYTSGHSK